MTIYYIPLAYLKYFKRPSIFYHVHCNLTPNACSASVLSASPRPTGCRTRPREEQPSAATCEKGVFPSYCQQSAIFSEFLQG